MLERLSIKNLAVIENAEVLFGPGLNILSGETGAGKSVLLDAIGLVLGHRTQVDLIRKGAQEAVVEGLFDVGAMPEVGQTLRELALPDSADPDRPTLLIKRSVHRGGKHRISINGETATLTALQQVCEGLVDLCSQSENQSLSRPAVQLDLLDRYGGTSALSSEFGQRFRELQDLKRELDNRIQAAGAAARQADFLDFQIQELQSAALSLGEDEQLVSEKALLQSAQQRLALADSIAQELGEAEVSALEQLRQCLHRAKQLASIDPSALDLKGSLERTLIEADESFSLIDRYRSRIELDSGRLDAVVERLGLLTDLKRKYGGTLALVLETLSQLQQDRSALGIDSERQGELLALIREIETELKSRAQLLTEKRTAFAKLFSESVTQELQELEMWGAIFKATLRNADWTLSGADQLTFEVQTNPGDQLRPMARVASGGELSRILLAVRRVIADRGAIGVYLFDEIDAGMGGKTAFQVGKKLKSVSSYNQVICITHLPQVACFGSQHWAVKKKVDRGETFTEIQMLSGDQRLTEIARMLSGESPSDKSLANARELLDLGQAEGLAGGGARFGRKENAKSDGTTLRPHKKKNRLRDSSALGR